MKRPVSIPRRAPAWPGRVRASGSLALLAVVTLTLSSVGCAHHAPVSPVSPQPKPDVGTLGLAMPAESSTASFQRPGVVGAGEGAKSGAKVGVLVPFVPGLVMIAGGDGRAVVAGVMLLGAGIGLAPFGAAVGAAVGAIAAPSKEDVERSAAALDRALAEANVAATFLESVMAEAGGRPIVRMADAERPAVDTVLQLDAPAVVLQSNDPTDWTPALTLRVFLGATLVRAADGEPIGVLSWVHEGPRASFFDWGKDDGRKLRDELERAARALARQALADLF